MSVTEPPVHATGEKGLQAGALGLVGNMVIGLASVAPAYSLAATLGLVVAAVGDKSPSMFVLAFIPMLLVAFAYRELSQDTPDCGTTFTCCASRSARSGSSAAKPSTLKPKSRSRTSTDISLRRT